MKDILKDIECRKATSDGKKLVKLSDGDGLYLWVYEDGRKYWRLRFWVDGKEKSLSLGVYPDTSLKEARRRRDDARRKQNEQGIDPAEDRKLQKLKRQLSRENSLEAVAREWFEKNSKTWVKHHADDVLRRLETNLFPDLGYRPIADIEPPELLAAVRKIEARGAYDLAHRVLGVCGQVFRYGIATGRCKRDIAADLRGALTPHKKTHQAAVKPEELPELLRAIQSYDKEVGDRQTRLALELLALTFVRTNELIGAEWPEMDLGAGIWIVPAARMKMKEDHVVPLSRQALNILHELKGMSRGSRFIFPGRNRDKPISNNTLLFALYRLGYKGRHTGHGFRAVASTALNEMGFRPDVIERQLAHCERNEVRAAYNRAEYLGERKDMMQQWADHLDALVAGAKVYAFKAA